MELAEEGVDLGPKDGEEAPPEHIPNLWPLSLLLREHDRQCAVAAGALSEDAAAAFRAHMSEVRGISRGDEENFRLLNSFNDIFVAIAIVIMGSINALMFFDRCSDSRS
mgnify:CR=1 FL=1